jgi:hypothetical protein
MTPASPAPTPEPCPHPALPRRRERILRQKPYCGVARWVAGDEPPCAGVVVAVRQAQQTQKRRAAACLTISIVPILTAKACWVLGRSRGDAARVVVRPPVAVALIRGRVIREPHRVAGVLPLDDVALRVERVGG